LESSADLVLLVTGLAIGIINSLAGAAGLLGLIALEEVVGLGTADANRSLRPSALGIGLGGMWGFSRAGRRIPSRAWIYGLAALPGAVAGTLFAIALPVLVYRLALLGVISVVLVQQLRPGTGELTTAPDRLPTWVSLLLFFLVGLHMGFVQVGTGLVAIAALTRVMSRDLVAVNSAKMAIELVSSATSTAMLAAGGHINWPVALPLALGAGLGSFLASRWSVRKGHGAVRMVVIGICGSVLAWLGWQALAD